MFKKLIALAEYFKKLDANAILFLIFSDKSFQNFIIDLNRKDQLMEGINSLGVTFSIYSDFTPLETVFFDGKQAQKGKGNPTILLDTAEFYNSFYIQVNNDSFEILANSIKDDKDLLEIFGKEIIGLTKESKEILVNSLRVKILQKIKKDIYS